MRISIDARIINSSTGTYIERLLHYLQTIDKINQYTVLVRKKDLAYWKPTAPNFKVRIADFDNYSLGEQLGFKKLLDNLKPDLVHFCMPQQPVLYKGLHITTVQDLTLLKTYNSDKNWLIFHVKQLIGRYVFKKIAQTSFHIITPSRFTKKDYMAFSGINPNKVTVIYDAAEEPTSGNQLTTYKHPFKQFLLYVGQQSDFKNIQRLAIAHQKLLATYPKLGLILVGRKNVAVQNNEQIFKRKKYKNILFTDFIPNSQRDWLYKSCTAYVFPSFMEGFGLPGLEAMTYGTPVVSSNATCLPEVYGQAAHYFNPLDTNDIARAISEVLDNKSLRQKLIKKGYGQLKRYSWLETAKQTHQIYLKVLETKS
jgi:glycosyltransferase involved in cell wall biosynthesis